MAMKTFKLTWNHGFTATVQAARVEKELTRYRFLDDEGNEVAAYTDPNITTCEETDDGQQ